MFGLGLGEFAVILGAGVLLFGAKRLPELARGVGQAIRELGTSLHDPTGASENTRQGTDPSSSDKPAG